MVCTGALEKKAWGKDTAPQRPQLAKLQIYVEWECLCWAILNWNMFSVSFSIFLSFLYQRLKVITFSFRRDNRLLTFGQCWEHKQLWRLLKLDQPNTVCINREQLVYRAQGWNMVALCKISFIDRLLYLSFNLQLSELFAKIVEPLGSGILLVDVGFCRWVFRVKSKHHFPITLSPQYVYVQNKPPLPNCDWLYVPFWETKCLFSLKLL